MALTALLALVAGCGTTAPATTVPTSAPVATTTPTGNPTATAGSTATPSANASQWIAYDWFANREHHKDVNLIHPDGSGVHAVAADIETNVDHGVVDWSPDGQTLVFVTGQWYDGSKIWTVAVEGGNATQLIGPSDGCRLGVNFPAYSMDGRKLLYVCDDGVAGDDAHITESLMVRDLATGASTKVVTFTLPDELLSVRWSPDGKSAVVELNQWELDGTEVKNIGSEVAVVTLADGKVDRLTESDSWAGSPDWSWTNGLITYGTYGLLDHDMRKPSAIYTVRPDGTDLKEIPTGAHDGTRRVAGPRWTPDGSQLIVSVATGHGGDTENVLIGFLGLDGTLTFIPADGGEMRSGAGGRLQPIP